MPTSIPYDPSLVLGNVVHPEKMIVLENISALHTPGRCGRSQFKFSDNSKEKHRLYRS